MPAKCFLPAYQKDITAGLFSKKKFFCKYIYVAEPNSCWQVQGGPFNSLSPQSLFPVLGAKLAVPQPPAPGVPWHRDMGQSFLSIRAHSSPAPSALGPRAAGPHQRGGGGCSSQQLFPSPLCSCREPRTARLPLAGAGTN